jgi:predicted nucleotidyltransferase component of viral defense system
MDNVARLPKKDRMDLFTETSRAMKMHAGSVEKDFWVCWVLDALFGSASWGRSMIFKGGTSLSKVFKCM